MNGLNPGQLTLQQILGFTVVGALVSTVGTLFGLVLKERVFARGFEIWKAKQAAGAIRRRYSEPIALAGVEIVNRLSEICEEHPARYLRGELLSLPPTTAVRGGATDLHYEQYKLLSSIYRLCSLLGWIELYRQDIVFLGEPTSRQSTIDGMVYHIRADLADGTLNEYSDWDIWCDVLLFREEQRAIGESMIVAASGSRVVMGYAEFCDVFTNRTDARRGYWLRRAGEFFIDPEEARDFRQTRMQRIIIHTVNLVELLEPTRLRPEHLAARTHWQSELDTAAKRIESFPPAT